jgi:hypothetical protein
MPTVEPGLTQHRHMDRGTPRENKERGKEIEKKKVICIPLFYNGEVEGDEVEAEAEAERQESAQISSVAAS